jgi:hypothetical protein
MNYRELYEKCFSGEIVLPIEVTIKQPLWDEFELDAGCKAKIIRIEDNVSAESIEVIFDFRDHEEYNKQFWKHDYYDDNGQPTLAIYETKSYDKLNYKCSAYCEDTDMAEQYMKFDFKKFDFKKMSISDIILNMRYLDEMGHSDKNLFIESLYHKLSEFHTIIVTMEKDEVFENITNMLRKSLNS